MCRKMMGSYYIRVGDSYEPTSEHEMYSFEAFRRIILDIFSRSILILLTNSFKKVCYN